VTPIDEAEPLDMGPNSGPRLAAMACPECAQVGKLSIWKKTVWIGQGIGEFSLAGEQMKISTRREKRPVMDCADCGQIAVGKWTPRNNIAFPALDPREMR
jgi:hypothetical protein